MTTLTNNTRNNYGRRRRGGRGRRGKARRDIRIKAWGRREILNAVEPVIVIHTVEHTDGAELTRLVGSIDDDGDEYFHDPPWLVSSLVMYSIRFAKHRS